ncbi:MAG: hypothetical protein PHV61_02660, partial [Limnochordia bacterium]|nr:hypothetical protein [Limnochordia bacterium]
MRRRSSIPVIVMLLFTLLCSIVNAQGLSDSQWVQVQSEVEALNLDYFRELALWQSVSNTLAAALADVSNPVIPQGIIGDTVPAVLEEGYSVTTAGQVASNLIIASQYGRDDDVELFVTHLIKQKQSATIVIQVSAVLGNTGKTTQDPDQLSDVVTSLSGFLTQMGDLDYSQQTLEDTLSVMEIVASLGDATNMLQVIEYLQDFLGQMGGSSVVRGTIQALYEASLRCNTADEVHRLIAQITGLVVDGAELGISDTGLENLLSALSSAIGQSVSAAEVEGLLSRLQALFQDAADMGMSGQEMTRTTSVLSNIVRNGESLSQINAALDTLSDVIGAGGDIDAVADLVLPVPEPPEKDTAPTEAEKLLAAARLAKGKGQYAEAVSLYQQAFDLEQSLLEVNRAAVGEVYFEWAIQLAATGEDVNLQLALEKLDLAIDIHPAGESGYVVNKAAVYLALGNLKMAAENWADAVDYFALAVELDQRTEYDAAHGSAYYQWALELVDLGTLESLQQALTKLDLAISANPTGEIEYIASKADVYLALGALYLDGAFYEQAIGAYTDAITLVDSEENKTARGQAYAAWAEALFLTEDYLGAIDKYKLATLDYPAGSALYDEKQALCYYMLAQGAEETDDVISYLTSAHELDPSYAADLGFAYAERAAEHLGLSEYEAAYDDMNIALRLIPEQEQNSELWYLMAATANGVEDYSTAVEYWLRWLNAPDVQVDVYYYYSVFLYCVGVAQDLDTALMVAEQAVLLFPGGFSYQILACANLVNGNIEEGLFTYLDGLKLVLASEDYTDEDIHYYISNYFDIAAYAFLIHPDLGLEEELLAQIGSVFYDAVSASIEEVVSTYDVIEGDFLGELAVVGITEEQVRTVFDTCIDHLLGQDLNAANIIPLLRETQFQLYDELLALATGDFAATAEAVNQAIFETLWVGEASLGGRLQTIMDTAVTTLRGISDRNEVLGSAVAVNLLWDCADYVGYDLDMEQAVLLIGATRHIISVRDEIRKMPRAIEIALAEFKERAEALQLGGIATAFDEVLAASDWKFDVDRRDWDWNSLEENEQAFLETFLKDPVGTLLVIQRAMEERNDVNDSAAAAMALWHSVGTEILPEAIGQIPDFTVEEWNTAATALMEAFMSLVTRTPIEDLWPSDEQKARNLVNQAIAA